MSNSNQSTGETGELQAYVAGVAEPLRVTVSITLSCTGRSDTPTPIEDTPNPVLPKAAAGCASVPGAMWALAVVLLGLTRRPSRRE